MANNRKLSVLCSGLISAGKSTLIRNVQTKTNMTCISEPINEFNKFECVDGSHMNPLSLFYENSQEHSGFVQLHILDVFEKLMDQLLKSPQPNILIWDRHVHDVQVFTNTLYKQQMMSSFAYQYCLAKQRNTLMKYKQI